MSCPILASVSIRGLPWNSAPNIMFEVATAVFGRWARKPTPLVQFLSLNYSLHRFSPNFSFLLIPPASVGFRRVHCGVSGAASRISHTVFRGDIRILWELAHFNLPRPRQLHWASGMAMSRRREHRPEVQTLYIPAIFGLYGGMGYLSSVGFLEIPACPCRGVGYGCQRCELCISRAHSDWWQEWGIFRTREPPRAPGFPTSGCWGRKRKAQTLYFPEIFGLYLGCAIFSIRGDARDSGISTSGRRVRKRKVRTLYFLVIFGF